MADVPTPQEIEAACPSGVAEAIPYLRSAGLSKVESMRVLVLRHGVSMSEAKMAVHHSDAWADRRASDDAFHDKLMDAVDEMIAIDEAEGQS